MYRIEYNRGNRAPVAALKVDVERGGIPLKVQFSSVGSYDLDSSKLSYKWYFDKKEIQSTDANPQFTFNNPGMYPVRLVVTDKEGKSSEKTMTIKAGNAEPQVSFKTDGNKSFYWSNTSVKYSIQVTDKEDGSMQAGSIPEQDVKVSLAYNTMGTDLTIVAQGHETTPSRGLALMEKSDCKSCHALNDKSVGPSYMAIAGRYKKDNATIKKLAAKVISGGAGVWGEFAMSAHPQLSIQQASDIVSYVLSVKDGVGNNSTVPATGTINPGNRDDNGEYILSVTYKDKERMGVESNVVKKNFILRHSRLKAVDSDDDKGVAKLGTSLVRFTETGSWIMFKQVDLSHISSMLFSLDLTQIGGKLSLRLNNPNGKEAASVSVDQEKNPQKQGPDGENKWKIAKCPLTPVSGIHDLYIVYDDPPSAKSSIWTTLYLDWIEFKKQP